MKIPVSKNHLLARLTHLRERCRHAFAVPTAGPPLTAEDVVLLQRLADMVVRRGMAMPALLFLESIGPMNFLGSQALHFFTPVLELAVPVQDVERAARLLERRDTLARLSELIEQRSGSHQAGAR